MKSSPAEAFPADWVELYNPGASAVDISGFVFKDNDETHVHTIPAATTISAGGYICGGGSPSLRLGDG